MELYAIKRFLDKSIEEKKIYCFHEYGNNDIFCGYVLSYNTDVIQIQHYTKFGEVDGVTNLFLSNIKNIVIQGEYSERIEYLVENQAQLNQYLNNSTPCLLAPTSDGFLGILKEYANDRSHIFNIEVSRSYYIGFVDEVNEHYLVFTEIANDGMEIGTHIFKIEDISNVHIDDRPAKKTFFVYNWRKKK